MEGMREEKRTTGSDVFMQGRVFLVQVFVQAKYGRPARMQRQRREKGGREDERRSGRFTVGSAQI